MLTLGQPMVVCRFPLGDFINMDLGVGSMTMLCNSTKDLEMNACEAPVSNKTVAGKELT